MNRSRAGMALAAAAIVSPLAAAQPASAPDDIAKGREQFHRTCSQCHGFNMVNSGTSVYDLRRFPVDDPQRFFNSVTNGKGNMPSFREALSPAQIELLWAYVSSGGRKER